MSEILRSRDCLSGGAIMSAAVYHNASLSQRNEYAAICDELGSTAVAEENAILSIGREFLTSSALRVLDGRTLSAAQEIAYFSWLTACVQEAKDDYDRDYAERRQWRDCASAKAVR